MKTILACFLLFFSVWVNADNSMTIRIDPRQTQFIIRLPANPTTGYQWTLFNYDQSLFKLISSHYTGAQTKLMGAGGKMLFTFDVVAGKTYPETTEILFKYAQPWKPKKGNLETVTINFSH